MRFVAVSAVALALLASAACRSDAATAPDLARIDQRGRSATPAAAPAPGERERSTASTSVDVAVIDAGVDPVPGLAGQLEAPVRCAPECTMQATPDVDGHGTAVASILAAADDRAPGSVDHAWTISVRPIAAVDARGERSLPAVANAVRWAAEHRIRVIALPLEFGGDQDELRRAITEAPDALVVLPAGNDGLDLDAAGPSASRCVDHPANVLCVAALRDDGRLDGRSNRGRRAVDLAAPGVEVPTSDRQGRARRVSGTSFAVPEVAGAAALLASAHPSATAVQLATALRCGARPLQSDPSAVGHGALDVTAALRRLDAGAARSSAC